MKQLFKGTSVDHVIERQDDDDIVSKFVEGFRLLPHQVQARKWMMERETGRSHGGILADDMGSVLFSNLRHGELNSLPGSEKRFRPSSGSLRENPTAVTRDVGAFHRLCKCCVVALRFSN